MKEKLKRIAWSDADGGGQGGAVDGNGDSL